MKTVIDNNQRVFQIVTSFGKSIFCNLVDINKVLHNLEEKDEQYRILHFWDNKPKSISKADLKAMFEAAGIDVNNKIFTIDIQCKEWFDKVNGNSYHAGEVTVNYNHTSEKTFKIPFQYGYGTKYMHSAYEVLKENKVLPNIDLYPYLKNNGIIVNANIKTNCKKAELK